MSRTARLFKNGRSQAVRLPADLRFEGEEVFIRRDETSGEVILSARPGGWPEFFALVDAGPVPADFLLDRDRRPPQDRDPL